MNWFGSDYKEKKLALAAKRRGNEHYSKQEWELAIKQYTEAIKLHDKDHSFYSNRSACYAAIDKFEEALVDAKKCVELKPDWAKGYGRVGYALYKLNKLEEAKKAYQDGLKIDGHMVTLKDGLAQCEQAIKKPKGQGLFGPQIWQTISLDPELRPYMNDKDFVQNVNMLNANPQMAMQMGVLNDPKIKKVFEKLMGMGFGTDNDSKEEHNKNTEVEKQHATFNVDDDFDDADDNDDDDDLPSLEEEDISLAKHIKKDDIYERYNRLQNEMLNKINLIQEYENQLKSKNAVIDELSKKLVDITLQQEEEKNAVNKDVQIEILAKNLVEESEKFKRKYNVNKLEEIFNQSPEHLMNKDSSLNVTFAKYKQNVNMIEVSAKAWNKYIQDIDGVISKLSKPNASKYKSWNIKQILIWIQSLENGRYIKHIDKLKYGFEQSEIVGEDLPDLTRGDLSSPPFNIAHFRDKKQLETHFKSLAQPVVDVNEVIGNLNEGAPTAYI